VGRIVFVVVVVLIACLAACAHAPRRADEVVIVDGAGPEGCERVGRVEGRAATGPLSFQEAARNAARDLQREAARRGATHVHITRRNEPGATTVVVGGTAYHCGDE
jgi:hypothetical protein